MEPSCADIVLLGLCVFREARSESPEARRAVAYVVMTRVAAGAWWGTDTMSVLFHHLQFSSLTAPNDPGLRIWPEARDPVWLDCLAQAEAAYTRSLPNPAPDATSYYDDSIARPSWALTKDFIIKIGRLNFFATR